MPISGVSIRINVVAGLLICEKDPDDRIWDINPLEFDLPFKELVLPKGYALIDIRKCLFEYIEKRDFKHKEYVYSGLVQIEMRPIKEGSIISVRQSDRTKSEVYFKFRCCKKLFEEGKAFTASMGTNILVFNRNYEVPH